MPTTIQPAYPTPQHAAASRAVLAFFQEREGVEAVLLVNSCARGKATRDSCLDIVVLYRPAGTDIKTLEALWYAHCTSAPVFAELERAGKYAEVHLDILTGEYAPSHREWTGGPDDFELQIGNHLVYSHPLWQGGDYLGELKARWLPYYPDELRRERLRRIRGDKRSEGRAVERLDRTRTDDRQIRDHATLVHVECDDDAALHAHHRGVGNEPVPLDLSDESSNPGAELDALGIELDRRSELVHPAPLIVE